MGSTSDESKMSKAKETLEEFGIEYEWKVLSAHRNPDKVVNLVSTARENGFVAFICGAGMAAHLAGVVAAHTTLPVVGVHSQEERSTVKMPFMQLYKCLKEFRRNSSDRWITECSPPCSSNDRNHQYRHRRKLRIYKEEMANR